MKKLFSLIKLMLLLCLVLLLMLMLSKVFRPKKTDFPNDTTNKVQGFYALEDHSIDVLFLGTSHTYYGFNPAVIYMETGLNSYVFAGECQPIGVTYHYLVEAYKTQSPKLIVLDTFALLPSADVCQTNGIIKVNLEDLRFSQNKVEALKLIKGENLLENVIDISIYKNRWNEIDLSDFTSVFSESFNPYFGYTDGFPVDEPIYERYGYFGNEMLVPDLEELEYLYKIFELAKEHGSEVLLVKTPYYETEKEYQITNYVFKEAREYGFKTINFNQYYEELDYIFDRDGDVWHCNVRGAWKISKMLSDYISENYPISIQESIYDQQYKELLYKTMCPMLWYQYDAERYLNQLQEFDVTLLVHWNGKPYTVITEEQWNLFYQLGISRFDIHNDYIAAVSSAQTVFEHSQNDGFSIDFDVNGVPVSCTSDGSLFQFVYEGMPVEYNHAGLNLIIIDNNTHKVIDRLAFDLEWIFRILRY